MNEEWAETDAGHIVVRESAPGRWRVTWYPNPGEPDFPGFTLDSATGAFPVDGGAAGILAWAKQQPWARRRRAASKPRSHPSDKPRAGRTGH